MTFARSTNFFLFSELLPILLRTTISHCGYQISTYSEASECTVKVNEDIHFGEIFARRFHFLGFRMFSASRIGHKSLLWSEWRIALAMAWYHISTTKRQKQNIELNFHDFLFFIGIVDVERRRDEVDNEGSEKRSRKGFSHFYWRLSIFF